MSIFTSNPNVQNEYILVPRGISVSANCARTEVELDISGPVDLAIAERTQTILLHHEFSVELGRDRISIYCEDKIRDTVELGKYIERRSFDVVLLSISDPSPDSIPHDDKAGTLVSLWLPQFLRPAYEHRSISLADLVMLPEYFTPTMPLDQPLGGRV